MFTERELEILDNYIKIEKHNKLCYQHASGFAEGEKEQRITEIQEKINLLSKIKEMK